MAGPEYVQLMASLPALGPILAAKVPPISEQRLEARLKAMLRPEHLAEIKAAGDLLVWSRLPLATSDADFIRQAEAVMPVFQTAMLRRLVQDRLVQRTVVAALRRRAAGQEAPPSEQVWGYGPVVSRITRNWRDPSFGLGPSFRWITPLGNMLASGNSAGAERLLLENVWRQAVRLGDLHYFDFEAVALYVVRWHLLNRWAGYDAEIAASRFGDLIAGALKGAPQLERLSSDAEEVIS